MSYLKRVLYSKETAGEVISMGKFKAGKKKAEFEAVERKLSAVGVEITKTKNKRKEGECEYRVNLKGGREATAYYSTDLNDAYDTGLGLSHWVEEEASVKAHKDFESLISTMVNSQKD